MCGVTNIELLNFSDKENIMNRFLALYFHWLDATEHRREFTHIYAKDLSEAIAKWSGICSANEQLIHIVPNPTPDQAWKLYDQRRAEQ